MVSDTPKQVYSQTHDAVLQAHRADKPKSAVIERHTGPEMRITHASGVGSAKPARVWGESALGHVRQNYDAMRAGVA